MNDLSLPIQEFFTARELAEMAARWGYKKLPHTESGVIRRAKRDGWAEQPSLCRRRTGSKGGGGLEYHISLLPDMQWMLLKERGFSGPSSTTDAKDPLGFVPGEFGLTVIASEYAELIEERLLDDLIEELQARKQALAARRKIRR